MKVVGYVSVRLDWRMTTANRGLFGGGAAVNNGVAENGGPFF